MCHSFYDTLLLANRTAFFVKREIFDMDIGGFPLHLPSSDERSRRCLAIHQSQIVVYADNQPNPSESDADTENAINIGTSGLEDDSDDL